MVPNPRLPRQIASWLSTLALAAGLATPVMFGGAAYEEHLLARERQKVMAIASSIGSSLTSELNLRIGIGKGVAAFVESQLAALETGQELPPSFDGELSQFTSALTRLVPGIRVVGVAPGHVMRHLHPMAGNEKAIGHALLSDPRPGYADTVRRAIATGHAALHGPLQLVQGGEGLIVRVAVLDRGHAWGSIGVVAEMPAIIAASGIAGRLSEYLIGLDTAQALSALSPQAEMSAPVVHLIPVPEGSWRLAIAPRQGWRAAIATDLAVFYACAAAAALSILALLLSTMRHHAMLRRKVTERTVASTRSAALATEARDRLQLALETIPQAFALFGPDDRLVLCNSAYRRMHIAGDEVVREGIAFEELMRDQARRGRFVIADGRVDDWVERRLAFHREPSGSFECEHTDGRWYQVDELRGPDGSHVCIRTDITERKRAAADLEAARSAADAANHAKSRFLATMSHEIRTPLSGVIGLSRLLFRTALDDEQRRLVQLQEVAARTLTGLIDDLLDMSKIEAGKLDLKQVDFDLSEVMETTRALLADAAAEKSLPIAVEIGIGVPRWLRGDAARLRQVLLNLVSNAVKYTHRGSVRLRVAALPHAGETAHLVFSVEDTGVGISAEDQRRLFTPFERFISSRDPGGTGLGLAISRQLVAMMGGDLAVASEPGRGSVFTFALALPAGQPAIEAEVPRSARGLRVLVAEDIEVNQLIVRSMLERAGHAVTVVDEGAAAVAALAAASYDIVLMDLQMPVMDGLEAMRRVRAMAGASGRVPILALTADVFEETVVAARAAGATGHLRKPIDEAAMLAAIDDAVAAAQRGVAADGIEAAATESLVRAVGPVRAAQLHALLLDEIPKRVSALEASRGDRQGMAREAHALISMAGSFGLGELAKLCAAMLEACRDPAVRDPDSLVDQLKQAADAATRSVQRLIA